MTSIAQLRESDPDLQGLDDQQVVDVVHQAYYPDLPREQVAKALGFTPPPAPEPKGPGLMGRIGDAALSLGQGIVQVPQAAVGLADMATGGRVGKALEDGVEIPGTDGFRARMDFNDAQKQLGDWQSDAQKAAQQRFQDAGKDETSLMAEAWEKTKAIVRNPSVAVQSVIQSIPSIGAGGVIGRAFTGALATMSPTLAKTLLAVDRAPFVASPAARVTADALGTAAGAVGEGVVGAGQQAEQIRTDEHNPDRLLTGTQAGLAGAAGAADTLFALVGGKVAHKLGIEDVDTMSATGKLLDAALVNPKAQKGVARQILEGFISEGALEELPQSIAEQVSQNLAVGDPIDKDVASQAVMGFFTGGLMGAGSNAWARAARSHTPQTPPAVQPPPITPAAPPAAPAPQAPANPTPQDVMAAPTVDAAVDTALKAAGVPAAVAAAVGVTKTADEDPFSKPIARPAPTEGTSNATLPPVAGSASSAEPAAAVSPAPSQPAGVAVPAPEPAGAGQQLPGVVSNGSPVGPATAPAAGVPAAGAGVSAADAQPGVGGLQAQPGRSAEGGSGGGAVVPSAGAQQRAADDAQSAQGTPAENARGVGGDAEAGRSPVLTPQQLALKLARASAAVREFEAKSTAKPNDDSVRIAAADARDVEAAAQHQIAQARAADPEAWKAYDAEQQQVQGLGIGARVMTPDGPGTVQRQFKHTWHVMVDGAGRQSLPPSALRAIPGEASAENASKQGGGEQAAASPSPAPAAEHAAAADRPGNAGAGEAAPAGPVAGHAEGAAQPALTHAARWDAMSPADRRAILATTKAGGKTLERNAARTWAELDPGWHKIIARAMPATEKGNTEGASNGRNADDEHAAGQTARGAGEEGASTEAAREAQGQGAQGVSQESHAGGEQRTGAEHDRTDAAAGTEAAPREPKVTPQVPAEPGTKYVLPSFVTAPHAKQQQAAAPPAPAAEKAKPEPSKNTVFTDDMAAAARARLKAKLARLGSGIDPEMLQDGIVLAGYHVEKGARTFAAFAKAMLQDMGEAIRPYVKQLYMALKYDPRAGEIAKDMSSASFVDEFDLAHITPDAYTGEDHGTAAARNLDRAGAAEPSGQPAEDVRAPEGERRAGDVAAQSGQRAEPANAEPAAPGRDVGRGLGTGEPGAVPASGERQAGGIGDAGQRGVSGLPRDDSGAQRPQDAGREGGLSDNPAPNAPPVSSPQITPQQLSDFTIADDFALGEGGQKTKFRANIDAIKLAREFMAYPERAATPQEQQILARYVGWGGLAQAFDESNADWRREFAELKGLLSDDEYEAARRSTRYAHFTSREIVDGIYAALRHMGFTGGRTLEDSAGVGNFIGLMPADMRTNGRFTAIERDPLSATIARVLYPLQNVQQADFTEWKGTDGYFDLSVGNPPFASDAQTDRSGRKHLSGLSLHNYFFAKAVDMLREGGILAKVVTNSFLDATGDKARRYIADRTKFLGAIRLPNSAFSKNAGTEVTTDIIFLQKRPEAEWGSKAAREEAKAWMDVRPYQGKAAGAVPLNVYFHEHPEMMLGDFGPYGTMYRKGTPALIAREGQDTRAELARAIKQLPEAVYKSIAETGSEQAQDRAVIALEKPPVQEGGYFTQDGKLIQRLQDLAGEARGVEITPTTQWTEKTQLGERRFAQIQHLAGMRGTLRALLAAEMRDDPAMEGLRKTLNEQYDSYRKEYGLLGDRGTYAVFEDDPDFPLLLSLEHKYSPGIGPAEAKKLGIKPTKSTAEKAPIFNRRVVETRKPVTRADSPKDALAISMAERGRLDAEYIGKLLGREPEEVLQDMTQGDEPLLFLDPATNEYALRDAYLSGNVRAKLEQARAAGMTVNARELERVQPEDVPAHQIAAKIGAPWVPTTVYEDFAKDLFGEGTQASIDYQKLNSSYSANIRPGSEVNASNKWGIPAYSGPELLSALLNNRTIKVQYKDSEGKTHTDAEKTEMAMQKAQEIKDRFQDWLFSDPDRSHLLVRSYNDTNNNYVTRQYDGGWMTFPGKVPDSVIKFRRHQRNAIARIVQDRTALLDHVVGAGKTFTVVAATMELKRTGLANKSVVAVPNHLVKQWAADYYRLYPGANVLTATKKDFERVNRRRFLAKIATGDWDAVVIAHSSFGFIQPGGEFEANFNQKQVEIIKAAIKEVEDSDADKAQKKRTVKQLEGMVERLENRIKRLRDKAMDDLLDFEELGVDQLFVDEAHLFKNLMYQTKLQNVAGLGDPAGSKRAYDMYVKTQEVMDKNGRGQGVVFATGTPVSNSLAEKYHMMRFLMPRQMEELGFQSFDAWANTFADVRQHWMQKVSGDGFKAQNRMSEFVNVHELLRLFDQVADTVTNDDIKKAYKEENNGAEYPLPPVKGGKPRAPVSLDKSPAQTAYMEDLARRAAVVEARKGPPQKGEDNHLSLMTDARKAAMDIRLVDMDATQREPGGRIDTASKEIAARYKLWNHVKGTQLVFSDLGTPKKHAEKELKEYQRLQGIISEATEEVRDRAALGDERAQEIVNAAEDAERELDEQGPDWLTAVKAALRGFSVYDDLKDALVEQGIPEHEIAFIHDYNTDEQKAALFRKVNSGDIRVVVGSTPKMGAGTNVQERLVALHHLDVPWKPSDVEQREGRIVRQGNVLMTQVPDFHVEIMAYVTKDTLDMRMWQIQEVKLKIINQLRTRQIERNIDNAFEDMEMSASEMQAAATGNMDLLYEIQARNDIKKLENQRRSFDAQKNDLIGRKKRVAQELQRIPREIEAEKRLQAAGTEYRGELEQRAADFKVSIDGKDFADRKAASDYLLGLYDAKQYTRTVERDGKKVREELSQQDYAALRAKVDEAAKTATSKDDPAYQALVHEMTSWTERAAPIDVTLNGQQYTARAKLAEAFSNISGDRTPIAFTVGFETYNRAAAAAAAISQQVADALADEKEATIGKLGPFTVTVEGQPKDKFGNKALDVVVAANGEKMDGYITSDEEQLKNPLAIAQKVIDFANRRATEAGHSLKFLEGRQTSLERQQADLDNAEVAGEWPGQQKLEDARKKHAEVLKRLATAKAAPQPAAGQRPEFRQGEAGDTSAPATRRRVGELQQAMDAIADEWQRKVPVQVVPGITSPSVPEAVREEAAARLRRGGGMPKATIYDGVVWMFADGLKDEREAAVVLSHEVLGHVGLRGYFGDALRPVLSQVQMLRRDDVRAMIERTGMDPNDPESRMRAAEEVLAYMAQERPESNLVQRAIAAIRTWLREHLPALFGDMQMSDAELIRNFILPARAFIEGGGPGPRGGMDFAQGEANKPFYSALARAMEAVPARALPVAGWTGAIQAQINKGAVKADEVEWSGLKDWLALQGDGKVSKQDVLDYLQTNGVRVEEVMHGGESGNGLPMFSQGPAKPATPMFSQSMPDMRLNDPRNFFHLAKEAVAETMQGTPGKLNWWHKTIGTQYNLAQRSPLFKRVFDSVQDFLEDVSVYATEAADKAPTILPQLNSWRDILPKYLGGSGKKALSVADNKAIRAPIFEGTLDWTRDKYGNPIRIDDARAAAKLMTPDQKAEQMVRNNQLSPNVLKMWRGLPHEQFAAMVDTRYENTALQAGIRWTRTELGNLFDLTEKQKDLYAEFRASVDESITRAALADMARFAGRDADFIRDEVMQAKDVKEGLDLLKKQLEQVAKDDPERAGQMPKIIDTLEDKARRAQELQDRGYAPLQRFGHYTVTVYGKNEDTGEEEVKYFGMYESPLQARLAAKNLADSFDEPGTRIERGTMNEESYKLFAGISPETVELFGEMLGMTETGDSATDQAFQAYLKLARNNRSAMRRLIHRKGTQGYSEDVGRVLASFTYSTARLTARNLHNREIDEAVRDIQLKDKNQGELARHAVRLRDYVNNPGEEAHALRGLLFAQYLGGSIASALVNMTQPFQVTMPYLSQFGGVKSSAKRIAWATANAWKANTGDAALDAAMKKAVEEGIVAPQEVHQLMAQGQGKGGLMASDGTALGSTMATAWNFSQRLMAAWGKPFSMAELFNRRVTFAAAYRTAQEQGIDNPFEFAKKAVIDTQFLYNKGNRPEWARGALGATLFTFKQYSVSYLEMVSRMWNAGEPGSPERAAGRRAVFFAAAMILLMGGAGGFPFVEDAEDIVDGVMQRLGYNWQSKLKLRELLQNAFGKAFGGFLEKGITGFPGAPIDVSGRLGMGNLIPGTGIFQKKQDHSSDILELAGPTGDLGKRAGAALNALGDGEYQAAARQAMPKAMRDVAKAIEMYVSGQYKNDAGYKVIDTSPADAIAKGAGFQPGDVATAQSGDSAAQQMVATARLRESEISAKWAQGIAEHDQAKQQEARRELADWNEKNPSTPIRVKFQDILRRAVKMNQNRSQRIAASTPKGIRAEASRIMRSTD